MAKKFLYFVVFLILFSVCVYSQPQIKNPKTFTQNVKKSCRVFLNGQLINKLKPIYPIEAKIAGIAGKVEVAVEIDETGNVVKIESVNGNEILAKSASEVALQAKFSPTTCDGKATKTIGVITFNFAPIALTREYFKPSGIEDFSDITNESNYYEAVLFLTENYRIAFGYADQKYHAEMILTRGNFAHFLRQMLEMLDSRGKLANKLPAKIGLYQSFNPHNLKEVEFNPTAPYAQSVNVLLEKYGIVLANENGKFEGDKVLTKAEITQIWRSIFGDEAIPINFLNVKDQEMNRGEFAIYLKESLDVLTYKILP
ncbi:MAG TPA: energy transducer TonB [Pyrinomonadaceae bacterium]|nr:energy transducer TonB [Pyrinomonadaceae bacterium]